MSDLELGWLAGILEGEGSFMKGSPSQPHIPKVALQTTDEDVIAKIASLTGVGYRKVIPSQKAIDRNYKQIYALAVSGLTAVKLMEKLYPLMSDRRKSQIKLAIENYDVKEHGKGNAKFTEKEIEIVKQKILSGRTLKSIADEYGVAQSTISRIKNEKRWKVAPKEKYIAVLA